MSIEELIGAPRSACQFFPASGAGARKRGAAVMRPLLPESEQQRLWDFQSARLRGERVPERYEHQALRKDGSQFLAEAQIRMMRYQDRDVRVAVMRDITARVQAEQERQDTEAALRRL